MRLLLSTCTHDKVDDLVRALLEERLIGCCNVLPGMRSMYRWKGAIEQDWECLLLMETTEDRVLAARDRLAALHPYETPKILILDGTANADFQTWLHDSTRPAASGD